MSTYFQMSDNLDIHSLIDVKLSNAFSFDNKPMQ